MTERRTIKQRINGKTPYIVGIPLAALLAGAAAWGAMKTQVGDLKDQIGKIEPRVRQCETTGAVLETKLDGLGAQLTRIENKLDKLEAAQ